MLNYQVKKTIKMQTKWLQIMTSRSKSDFIKPTKKRDSRVNHHHNNNTWKGAVCLSDSRVKLETFEEIYFIQ